MECMIVDSCILKLSSASFMSFITLMILISLVAVRGDSYLLDEEQ